MTLRMLMALIPFLAFFANDSGGDDDPNPNQNPDPDGDGDDGKGKVTFTTEQQAEIDRIIGRRVAKAKETGRAERDAELEAERAAEEAKRQREADEAKGDFEKVKSDLIAERDTATASLTSVQEERDELLEIVRTDVDAVWADLPTEVREAYDGDEGDVMARKRHMQKMKGIIERLKKSSGGGGNPRPPAPNGQGVDIEAEIENAKQRVKF